MSLKKYSNDELLEELVRRRNARTRKTPERWCHDCKHFRAWIKPGDPPSAWSVCSKGRKTSFWTPQDMNEAVGEEFGYYRRVCADRDPVAQGHRRNSGL